MAISTEQKLDYLWKKLGYGATKTDTNAIKKAPNEAIASPLLLRGDKVWQQATSIPTVLPGSSAGVVTVYPTSNPIECTEDATSTANRTWKTGVTDWIPPEIASTYQVKVYIHTAGDAAGASGGNQVFATGSGNDDEWFFDYQSGVLHFIGDNLPNGVSFTGKSVYISGGRYTGTFGVGTSAGTDANIGNLVIVDTTISTVNNDANIVIDTKGDGTFQINSDSAFLVPVGNTAARPSTAVEGYVRFNTDTTTLEWYDGTEWDTSDAVSQVITTQTINPDGVANAYTLTANTTSEGILVSINGTLQQPSTAYSVSGNLITFAEVPLSTDIIEVRSMSTGVTAVGSLRFGSAEVDLYDDNINFTGDFIPTANISYDIGSTANQVRNFYAGGNVEVGGYPVSTFVSTAPTSSKGQSGDKAGMVASNGNYVYICYQDYTTGTANIWANVTTVGESW